MEISICSGPWMSGTERKQKALAATVDLDNLIDRRLPLDPSFDHGMCNRV